MEIDLEKKQGAILGLKIGAKLQPIITSMVIVSYNWTLLPSAIYNRLTGTGINFFLLFIIVELCMVYLPIVLRGSTINYKGIKMSQVPNQS